VLALALGAVFAVGVQLSSALPAATVSFDANAGGGTMTAQTASTPTPLTLNSFTRAGNSFQKWNTAANGSGTSYSDGATYEFSASTTLYAQWVTSGNVVTFNANNGTGYMGPQVSPVAGNLNFNTFTRTGYVFTGWTTASDGSGASYVDGALFPFSTLSTALWAKWATAPTHAVTFNANGGAGTMSAQSSNVSANLSANSFTLTGSGFSGWNTAADGTGTPYAAGASYSFAADVTLYARWTLNTYTVTFVANGTGTSGSMTAQTFTHSVAAALSTNTFSRTNYLFAGWNTLANGTGTAFAAGASTTFSASTTLYAQWTNQIPIAFDANLGSGTMAPQNFTIASAGTLPANTFTRTDYMFIGWNTLANGSGTAYLNLASATFSSATTVYAQWVSVPSGSAGIVFNPNTGSGTMTAQVASTPTAIKLNSYTPPSSKLFQGWNTAANGSGTSYSDGQTYPFTTNVTLYAQWGTAVSVRLDANSGSGTMASPSFTYNVQGTLPANTFTRTDYMFIGWNTIAVGGGTAYLDLASATFTAHTTLYAQWVSVPSGSAGIVFNPNAGTGTMTAQVASAPTAIKTNGYTAPSGSGKVLQGWNTSANGSGTAYGPGAQYPFTTNVTLYAQWGYQVTFNANGGSGTMAPQVGFVSTTNLAANTYTQAGSVFIGWTTNQTLTGTTSTSFYGDGASIASGTFTTAKTLYAQWAPGTAGDFGVIFLGNGGATSGAVTVTYQTASGSTALTANPFILAGNTFLGWATTSGATSATYAEGTLYSFTASKMLYAVWQTNKVTFDANGGTGTTAAQSSTTDATLTTSGFTRSGFVFSGWNTATDGSGVSYGQNATYPFSISNNSAKLYAQWTVVPSGSFYVMFLGNSASGGSMLPQISATNAALTPNAFTRTGYSFAGWNTSKTGTGTSYTDGQTFGFGSSITVYAIWKPILTYKANYTGGAPDIAQIVTTPTSHNLAPLTFSRTNYAFVGWNDAANGSGTWYLNSQTGISTFTTPTTLYAQWVAVSGSQYLVTFWPADTTVAPTTQLSAASAALNAPPSTTTAAKTFLGWATSSGGSVTYLDGATYPFSANIILYPVTQANTVTFDANGGTGSMSNQTASSSTKLTVKNFTRTGFTFNGWKTNANGSGTSYADKAYYSFQNANMTATLYAQWTPSGYSVTFNANGGAGTMAAQAAALAASVALSPNQFSYFGKVFTGWTTAADGTGTKYADGASVTSSSNVTLYAQWATITTHVVHFDANGLTTGTMADATTSTGSLVLPVNTFSGIGAIFYGWNTVADGSGTGYADHSQMTVAADTTLYAKYITYDAGQVSISFDGNGGTGTPVRPLVGLPAATGTAPANPFLRPGFVFAGWNTTADGTGTTYAPAATLTFADTNTTLYAKWTQTWFTVTFYGNNGSGTMTPQTSNSASNLTANSFTRPNYTFAGWTTAADGTGTKYADSVSYPFTADRTLYAQWTATAFTVTFVAQGGTGTMLDQTSPKATAALQANAYSRPGYVFAGWTTNADGTGTPYTNGQNYGFAADLTLYAQWTAIYTVTFDNNTGTGAMATQSGNTSTPLNVSGFSKFSYLFAGWNTAADGTGTTYLDGATYPFTASTTLYAKWTLITFPVVFDGNSGSGSMSTVRGIGALTLPTNTFTRVGYTFLGWAQTDSAPTATFVNQGGITVTSAMTLYAVWRPDPHTVTYDSQGGLTVPSATFVTDETLTLPADPTRAGYIFTGWFFASSGGATLGAFYSPSPADLTLYAHWTVDSHTVTYDTQGGSTVPSATFNTDATITLPADPTRTGYTFTGWFVASSGGTALGSTYSPGPATDLTLYAHWSANSHILTYDSQAGSPVPSANFVTDATITLHADPTRTGYTFTGWFVASSGGTALGSTYSPGPATDLTLYAHWTADSHTVTYDTQGGSTVPSATFDTDATITLPAHPTRAGYTFTGWFVASSGGITLGASYSPGPATDLTLYSHWSADSHTISYDSQGGLSVSSAAFDTDATITLPTDPTRDGYTFLGWFVAPTGGTTLGATYTHAPASDVTLYAHWSAESHTVFYSTLGGSTVSSANFVTDATITLPSSPTRDGYTFTGWFVASTGGTTLGSTYSPGPATDLTLYAHWSADSHTVTYDAQGGTIVSSAPFDTDATITLPSSPTRDGYTFAGWFVASTGGTALGNTYSPGPANDLTIFAQWSADRHTLTYDTQGGSTVSSANFVTDATITLAAHPTRAGYTFSGWFVASADGTALGSTYSPGPATDLTLYAHWSADSHTVNYDTQGGSTAPSASFLTDGTITLPANPTRTGYTFSGWFVASSGGTALGGTYSPGPATDITLYAQWSADSHTLTYDTQGGSSVPSAPFLTDATITLPSAPTRAGYTFTGWFVTTSGGTNLGAFYSPPLPTDLTLYAQWTAESHTVTYNTQGGSSVPSASFVTDATIALPGHPTRPGHTFTGWFSATTGGTALGATYAPAPATDVTLYAHWSADAVIGSAPPIEPVITPTHLPSPSPTGPAVATIDLGQGTKNQSASQSPLEALLSSESLTRTVTQLQQESIGGFRQGSSAIIKISGARTAGQFVFSGAQSIDTVAIAAALSESESRQATDFAKLTSVTSVASVDWSKVTTKGVTVDAANLFKAIGLSAPRTLANLPTKKAKSWIEIRGNAVGYVPGSVVYLAVTTDPIILASATVDKNGNVALDGLLPVDLLDAAAHSIRIVGTRDLQGVSVGKDGTIRLADSTMSQIQNFDKGTNAVVEMSGVGTKGPHVAVRLIALIHNLPWWVLWIFLGVLALLFVVRLRNPDSKVAFGALWIFAVGGMITVEVVAWMDIAYAMLPYAPLATIVALAADVLIAVIRRGRHSGRLGHGELDIL